VVSIQTGSTEVPVVNVNLPDSGLLDNDEVTVWVKSNSGSPVTINKYVLNGFYPAVDAGVNLGAWKFVYRATESQFVQVPVQPHTHPFAEITSAPIEFVVACSNETAALTAGVAKVTFRTPVAFRLSAVAASLTTASTNSALVVDINNGANSVLSTKLSIDSTEKTSATAASAAVINASQRDFAQDAVITIDLDQAVSGSGATGLKVVLRGTRL
jgi:hypothetical protein